MLPYKFVLVQLIYITSCFLFSIISLYKVLFTSEITPEMRKFPQYKILIMAVFDTLQFLWLVFSAPGVSPTMTALLLHSSTPLIVAGSRLVFPFRRYSGEHYLGACVISLAVLLGSLKPLLSPYPPSPPSPGLGGQLASSLSYLFIFFCLFLVIYIYIYIFPYFISS
jgi:hypothetical protein